MIKSLDSFRFFAFLAVFLVHTNQISAIPVGVQAFFVLSGFLLTPILLRMKESMPVRNYFLNFYGRRALRIFPLYYTYVIGIEVISFLPWFNSTQINRSYFVILHHEFLYALTYVYDFFCVTHHYHGTYFLCHFWSLAVEEQFYLVWPAFLLLIPRKRLPAMLAAIIICGPCIRYLLFIVSSSPTGAPHLLNPFIVIYSLPFGQIDAFAVGGLMAILPLRVPKWAPWLAITVTMILGFGTYYLAHHYIPWRTLGYPGFFNGERKYIWGYTVWNCMCAIILGALRDDNFLPWLFNSRILCYLGKISYGLYVFHYAIIMFFFTQMQGWFSVGVRNGIILAVTVALSIISYELYEKHFLKLKDRWFPREMRTRSQAAIRSNEPELPVAP